MLRYLMNIQWNNENNAYDVIMPELPGCFARGDTYEEAAKNGREAIETFLVSDAINAMPEIHATNRHIEEYFCSHCQKSRSEVKWVKGNINANTFICNECTDLAREIMEDDSVVDILEELKRRIGARKSMPN